MLNEQERYEEKNRPTHVEFKDRRLCVTLGDGRMISTPLEWYPRLTDATPEQLMDFRLMDDGIHWNQLDEDLSVFGMLKGNRAVTFNPTR